MRTIQYPGGKRRIAPWIVDHMPPHHSYLEPFFGGGAALFEKEPSPLETINDLDGDVVNLFQTIRSHKDELIESVAYTPYSREEYGKARCKDNKPDELERARRFLIRSMQSFGFRLNGDCGWKRDVHGRESAYALRHWNDMPEVIAFMAQRLKSVQIECRPAVELIKQYNHSNVLIYADPPYVLSTRCRKMYNCEMTDHDHVELLDALLDHTGSVMLSGYESELYDRHLQGWRKLTTPNRSAIGSARTEVLWINY